MSSLYIDPDFNKSFALLTLGLTNEYTLISTAGDYRILPTDRIIEQTGNADKLIYDEGNQCIKIGPRVNTVEVAASVYFTTGQQADDSVYASVVKNNGAAVANLSRLRGDYETRLMSKKIAVQEGDKIFLGAVNKTRTGQVISSIVAYTWLQVTTID